MDNKCEPFVSTFFWQRHTHIHLYVLMRTPFSLFFYSYPSPSFCPAEIQELEGMLLAGCKEISTHLPLSKLKNSNNNQKNVLGSKSASSIRSPRRYFFPLFNSSLPSWSVLHSGVSWVRQWRSRVPIGILRFRFLMYLTPFSYSRLSFVFARGIRKRKLVSCLLAQLRNSTTTILRSKFIWLAIFSLSSRRK